MSLELRLSSDTIQAAVTRSVLAPIAQHVPQPAAAASSSTHSEQHGTSGLPSSIANPFAIESSPLRETLAGILGGIAGKIVDHPLDTVKTRLQEQDSIYRNPLHCCKTMFHNEGMSSFFRGISPPMVVSAYEHAFTFLAYSEALSVVNSLQKRMTAFRAAEGQNGAVKVDHAEFGHCPVETRAQMPLSTHALAGGISGLVTAHVLTPAEFLKCRMQQRDRTATTFRSLLSHGGWRRLFDGHGATVAREIPGTAAWFVFYEASLRGLRRMLHESPVPRAGTDHVTVAPQLMTTALPDWATAVAGGLAGVMYWTAFFPADVVKTRMQLDPQFARKGLFRALRHVYRKEGFRALYCGWTCTVLSAFPGNAAIFLVYEKASEFMT